MTAKKWAPERVRTLKEMWVAGDPYSEMAEALGTTVYSVKGKAHAIGLRRDGTDWWTVERDNRLKELRQRGFSARQIGADIGVSKNAVIGRANRLGLSNKSKPKLFAFSDTRTNVCQFPNGHVGEPGFHFCEAEVVPGRPYCAEHCALCYRNEKDLRVAILRRRDAA